jgi:CheY-like chemotaxis protein
MRHNKNNTILIADDDEEIRMLMADALAQSTSSQKLCFVENGQEVLDYLRQRGKFQLPEESPQPGLILLDLNMPQKDGREVLQEIKTDPDLRHISVVMMTAATTEEDIYANYKSGANSFMIKPRTFQDLTRIMNDLVHYWFETVELPQSTKVS